jgi:hypothetical protein
MEWFDLGKDTHRCWTVVNGVMKLTVSQNAENFSNIWEHSGFSNGSVELIISIITASIKPILKPVSYRPNPSLHLSSINDK